MKRSVAKFPIYRHTENNQWARVTSRGPVACQSATGLIGCSVVRHTPHTIVACVGIFVYHSLSSFVARRSAVREIFASKKFSPPSHPKGYEFGKGKVEWRRAGGKILNNISELS